MTGIKGVAMRCAVFVLAGVLLLALLYNTMIDDIDGEMAEYDAQFTEVSGLRVGDDVRIAGVKVGSVQAIAVDGDSARVDFTVQTDHRLSTSTGMVLRYQNLIGQRYVALVPGKEQAGFLAPGSTIPFARTSQGFDLSALLNGFRPLFAVLKPADINALSESIVKVLQGEGGTVDDLFQQTTELTNYLADREDLFHQVATNLTPVLKEVAGNGELLETTVHRLAGLTTGLAKGRATMGRSIDQLSQFVGTTNTMITEIRAPLRRDIATLRKVVGMYAANSSLYGDSFAHFGSILEALGRTTSYRSAINQLMCKITLRSGSAEVLVGSPNDRQSEVCR
jgi:phospholipid/cholesterol/gamma-HCH transport system substrate-binding protein